MTSLSDNYILCFDARVLGNKVFLEWSAERKQNFLYRLDISYPISTDRFVLDTIDSRYCDADTLPYAGPFSPFWGNLFELQRFLEQFELNPSDYFLLAISVDVSLLTQSELEYWYNLVGNKDLKLSKSKLFESLATPNKAQEGWSLLGYDVSDSGFTSAVSNMGFTSDDNVPSLRARWGPCLNAHHLFDRADDAVSFKEFSNQRIPEHAPFSVFGLWEINIS